MTDAAVPAPVAAFAAAAVAISGIVLLASRIGPAIRACLRALLGVVFWCALWQTASVWLGGAILSAWSSAGAAAWVNFGFATASAIAAWMLVALGLGQRRVSGGVAVAAAVLWTAGAVVPLLGQGGVWPPVSVALASWCLLLAGLGGGWIAVRGQG